MKKTFLALALAVAMLAPQPARAEDPADRLGNARAEASDAQADFASLLARYRRAALRADDAVAKTLAQRSRAERLRVSLDAGRRAFAAGATRAYIDGPGAFVEAFLNARDIADLNALMPFAESHLSIRIEDARALSARAARIQRLLADVERRQAAAFVEERRLHDVSAAIARRLREADAAVRSAQAAVDAENARRKRDGLNVAWSSARKAVDLALYQRRKARGEQQFRDAAPFLGPRAKCDAPAGLRPAGATLSGKASWYGNEFAGKGTASGAVYDPWRYTVAHRSLPFGLYLLIESDGKCVMSFLNDRGPYIYDRILDLSAGSAKAVGLSGVEHVEATIFVRDE